MARPKVAKAVKIHEDETDDHDEDTIMDESRGLADESGATRTDDSDESELDESVAEDIARFEASFKGINKRYRLISRIGEGTFSTVYKAEDLHYHQHKNEWDVEEKENLKWSPSRRKASSSKYRRPRYVAIKKIYVTSSPLRILNELELLYDLRDSDSVCPLITAFRHQDQVIAVLPYFQHHDFRHYFRDMTVADMRLYFRSLFTALRSVHEQRILHRDIKPTNFLYNPERSRGVLVDFGLAEREGTEWTHCACELDPAERRYQIEHSYYASTAVADRTEQPMYPKNDNRQSRRANRAGTRGFRAPEVLFKCTAQTCAIDMWSAGIVLLALLAHRFPFFHSVDDIDALLELTNVFGCRRMRETAFLHGQVFETNIPSYCENGHRLEKIILWSTNRSGRDEQGKMTLEPDEAEAVAFLERCLEFDPKKRITAEEALCHPFIAAAGMDAGETEAIDLIS